MTTYPTGTIPYIAPIANQGAQTSEDERRALGLTLFAGEVMNAYYDAVFTEGKVRTEVINEGVSAQFPHTGVVQGGFHEPGTALTLNQTKQAARYLTLDDILYAAISFPLEYDLIGHLGSQTRSAYATGAGQVLAQSKDIMNFAEIIKAARSAPLIAGETDGGSEIISDSFKIGAGGAANEDEVANAILMAIFAAKEIFDQKSIPSMQRYMCISSYHYNLLVRTVFQNGFALSNKDYMSVTANYNDATLPPIAGIQIGWSNLLPKTNLTATGDAHSGTPNTLARIPVHSNHAVNASKTIGLIWTPECVGNVVRQGIASKMEEQLTHLSDLNVTYMLCGAGVLRPEHAIELKLKNLSN